MRPNRFQHQPPVLFRLYKVLFPRFFFFRFFLVKLFLLVFFCCSIAASVRATPSTGGGDDGSYQYALKEIKHVLAGVHLGEGSYSFTRLRRRFYHSPKPFETLSAKYRGVFEFDNHGATMFVADTFVGTSNTYAGYTLLDATSYGTIGYGDTVIAHVGWADRQNFLFASPRYSPAPVLQEFLRTPQSQFIRVRHGALDTISYFADSSRKITVVIDPKQNNVVSLDLLEADDFFGDVQHHFEYQYTGTAKARYPNHVTERQFGVITEDITIARQAVRADSTPLVSKMPEDYDLGEAEEIPAESIREGKWDDHIRFFELRNAESRVLIVNFSDYLLIAEAPESPENGELILKHVHALFPNKPVRYFLFGHHHPSYLGGVRAMVHEGVTVLALPQDTAYVRFIIDAPHTLKPDSLSLDPKPLKLALLDTDATFTDGIDTMRIFKLGARSKHTDDYLVYYFPHERMLFEDDLLAIDPAKPLRACNDRELGVYAGIGDFHLDPDVIVQSWPIRKQGDMVIPYSILKACAEMTATR